MQAYDPFISFRNISDRPQTPEHDRQGERERERLQHLQMTSPSIRRQCVCDRQPIPQPNFGSPPPPRGPPMVPMHFQAFQPSGYSYNTGQGSVPYQMPAYHQYAGQYPAPPRPAPVPATRHWPVPVDQYPGLP